MNTLRFFLVLLLASWSTAAPVTHLNLSYSTKAHERHKLDLYLPEKSDRPAPLLIWIHGGGWQNGSKENCLPLRQGWIERGYAIASINYRLSSHAIFPAQIEDCKAAIRWLRANATMYQIDPARFGVWGSSAGGHLAALVGTSGDLKAFDVGDHLDQSSSVQAVCDYFGPTDFKAFVTHPGYENHSTATSPESLLLGGTVKDKPDQTTAASPLTYITPDDPPFLIVHGDKDPVVPLQQSELLYNSLKAANRNVHFHTIQGATHGQGFAGPEILTMVQAFFDLHLKGEKEPITPTAITSNSKANNTQTNPGNRQLPTFDQILTRHDTNRDGKIARDEFRGPTTLFDRLDANKDAFVTREEHQPLAPAAQQPTQAKNTTAPEGFTLTGDQWTWREGDFIMQGILLKPAGTGPFPAVLISHGLGGSAQSFGRQKASELVKLGYVCIAPDFTHTGGARGTPSTTAGARPENIRRATTCLDILTKLPEVNPQQLFAYGHSMGGFVTIALAAAQPNRLQAAAITGSGITPQEGMAAPSSTTATKIRTPFLLFHGSLDTVVRPEQSAALEQILQQQKVPHQRVVFEGEGHPIDQTQREKIFPALHDWFQKHRNRP